MNVIHRMAGDVIRLAAGLAVAVATAGCASVAGGRTASSAASGSTTVPSRALRSAAPINTAAPLIASSLLPHPPRPPVAALPFCQPGQVQLAPGPMLSGATGEHGLILELRLRTGQSPCSVSGYPQLQLTDGAGRALPFRISQGDPGPQFITAAGPHVVQLRPGAPGYLLIAKYRCDLSPAVAVATVRVTLKQVGLSQVIALAGMPGVSQLSYCVSADDRAGRTVGVSPIEPNVASTAG